MSSYSFLVPEMAHDVIENQPFFWITRSLDIVCALAIVIIGIYHSFALYSHSTTLNEKYPQDKSKQEVPSERKRSVTSSAVSRTKSRSRSMSNRQTRDKKIIGRWSMILHSLTLLFIIFSFIVILILTLNIWSIFPMSYSCDQIVYILCISFHCTKSIFYCILITRLQVAFGTSAYGYSNCQIYFLYSFVIIYTIFICIGTPFLIYGTWLNDPYNWCHVHIFENKGAYVPIGVLSWIIMDMLISIVLLYLFQKPIRTLLSNITKNKKLANLMIKYTILTWMAIILSMLSLLLYLWKHITTLIEINLPFTCFFVILMHVKYDNVFRKLCGLCTKCCHKLCSSHHQTIEKQTEEHVISYEKPKLSIDERVDSNGSYLDNKNESSFVPSNDDKPNLSADKKLHVPQESDHDVIELAVQYSKDKDRDYSNGNNDNNLNNSDVPTPTPTNDNDADENNVIIPVDNGFPDANI